MLQKAERFIAKLPTSSHFLLACSGGVDSMALLHFLNQAGFSVAVAHCHFNLRGSAADADAELVRKEAANLNFYFHYKAFNTQAFADENGISIQMAARDLRYAFFNEILKNEGYTHLVTAHHLDDSLETLLLNLGRGTGLAGLRGIAPIKDSLIRPFSQQTKAEILEYAHQNNIAWRDDASNSKTEYKRNYLRHKVIPAYRKNFEGFEKGLRSSLENLTVQEQALNYLLEEKLNNYLETEGSWQKLPVEQLANLPFWPALLHHWLKPFGNFDFKALQNLKAHNETLYFSNLQYNLHYSQGYLWLKADVNTDTPPTSQKQYLIAHDQVEINEPVHLKMTTVPAAGLQIKGLPTLACLDFDKLIFPLSLRQWQTGDRFKPLGLKGRKKLSDFFTNRKFSAAAKKEQWLLCSGNTIVWVIGQQIDDRYKLTNLTKTIYFAQLIK
jgi:tRNA(Ile)-lysidine synthase